MKIVVSKSASVSYELNGESFNQEFFETTPSDLGIETIMNELVNKHPMFVDNGWDTFKVIK